jgi:hypothetical protein
MRQKPNGPLKALGRPRVLCLSTARRPVSACVEGRDRKVGVGVQFLGALTEFERVDRRSLLRAAFLASS